MDAEWGTLRWTVCGSRAESSLCDVFMEVVWVAITLAYRRRGSGKSPLPFVCIVVMMQLPLLHPGM